MIEETIYSLITGDAAFAAVAADRLFPVILPKIPTLPAVTYQRITTRRSYATAGPIDLNRIRIQFDCWAATYPQAKDLQHILLTILEDPSRVTGTAIQSIQLDTASDGYADDARLYRVSMDFIVYATE